MKLTDKERIDQLEVKIDIQENLLKLLEKRVTLFERFAKGQSKNLIDMILRNTQFIESVFRNGTIKRYGNHTEGLKEDDPRTLLSNDGLEKMDEKIMGGA